MNLKNKFLSTIYNYFIKDDSLDEFTLALNNYCNNHGCGYQYVTFEYRPQYKNKLYQAITAYEKDHVIFYSNFTDDNPNIDIRRIGEIFAFEKCDLLEGKCARPNGTFYLKFTVYYEKFA
jgi:hypothetical protein